MVAPLITAVSVPASPNVRVDPELVIVSPANTRFALKAPAPDIVTSSANVTNPESFAWVIVVRAVPVPTSPENVLAPVPVKFRLLAPLTVPLHLYAPAPLKVVPCPSETALPMVRTPELEVTADAVFSVINPPVIVVVPVEVKTPVTAVVPELKLIPFKVVLVPPSVLAPVNVPFPFSTATPPD